MNDHPCPDEVFPDQTWRDPDGSLWRVGAIMWSGTERTALLTRDHDPNDVLYMPAAAVAAQFVRVPTPIPRTNSRGGAS